MNIKELVDALDKQMVEKTDAYIKMHDEFNKYRGVMLDDKQLKEVNGLLMEIQESFQELYPVFYFIAQRYESTNNFVNGFETFIGELKKAGATESEQGLA